MGGMLASCQSEEVREQLSKSKAIEKQLSSDRRAASSIIKLLLLGKGKGMLVIRNVGIACPIISIFDQIRFPNIFGFQGAGECGKSTVLKQMQILHSNGFTEEEINERR